MADSKVTMKLLVDSKRKRVVFAEAGKECVDFLFHILTLPIGSVISLLTTKGMVGCLGNLYESLENLNDMYIQPNQHKDIFLKPKLEACATSSPLLLLTSSPVNKQFYHCRHHLYVTDIPGTPCPSCAHKMSTQLVYVVPTRNEEVASNGGLVKGVVTYMVLDDLTVKPMSSISSITLLNELFVTDVGVLKEKVITLGMDEALNLLKTSLQSKNVLTDVFMASIVKD